MTTIAAGMESDSETDCDIVFPSNDKFKETKVYQNPHTSSKALNTNSVFRDSQKSLVSSADGMEKNKIHLIPNAVARKMSKNNNIGYSRKRALKHKTVVFDDLRYAILQGNFDATKSLYESNGIDVDTILKSGWTGLMYACSVGYPEIVDFLLQRHANSNFHQDMFTPLMAACISKKNEESLLKCCTLLLNYKANVNVHDRFYTTPLIFAAREGHTQIVRFLLEHGAEINASDNRGYTALSWAAYFGRGYTVRVLLEWRADKKQVNSMGQSPADIALDNGHNEVASLFEKEHISENDKFVESQNVLLTNEDKKIISNSKTIRNLDNSKIYIKLGELDVFLIGIDCQDLIEKFNEHHLSLHDLLIMDDTDLEKIGIFQAGLRKKILEACKAVHKKDWENSSLPNLRKNHYISCPDAVAMLANISKHLKYISTSVIYIRNQIQSQPRILELAKESANIHNLMDEVEDSLKNLHTLKDEMRFLKMHLVKVQHKPEYISNDVIVETVSKQKSNKTIYSACGIATLAAVLAIVWLKYPGVLNNLQPSIFIRIPFIK